MTRKESSGISEQSIDELLELIWISRERKKDELEYIVKSSEEEDASKLLNEMEQKGLVGIQEGRVTLSKSGEKKAEDIIRRHRLAESLLSEIFELPAKHIHPEACKFEHILSIEVTDSVCTFLGHPPMCPHNKPIPRANCCAKFKKEVKPLVLPLGELTPGQEGRIVFIVPKEHARLDRLSSLGVLPGSIIKLHQKQPSYVVKIGETELALDEEIVSTIYVKRV
ncbi:MAG: metal-dependent transcriptional regulator [Candidatus Hydrothermarchaeales archaeon]